jgi:DNA-binding LacI/PurR family transcriptional regulator
MRYVTIKDIAKALGISKSTVSRALSSDSANVSEETMRKVVEAAHKMGYKKNEMAVNFRQHKAKTIGIVVPEAVTSFYLQFTARVQHILHPYGYRIILALSDEDFLTERSNLEIFNSYRVDGILISACHHRANVEFYNDFLRRNIPMVLFDRTIANMDCSSVRSDDYSSAFFLVEHLIYKGYNQILHMAGPDYIRNSSERLRAYCDVLKKHGIPYRPELVVCAGVDEKDGARAMAEVLDSEEACDAVFCFTETQALGAKKTLQERNIRVPDDVAIACMSGTNLATLVHPSITAVEQPLGRMAEEAVRLLLSKIENPLSPSENVVLTANMIIRSSTEK